MRYSLWLCLVFTLVLVAFSCKSKRSDNKDVQTRQNIDSSRLMASLPIKKFSLPYESRLGKDSDLLIYARRSPFDTSYVLHVIKENSDIHGVFYVVLPTFHRDLADYYDEDSKLLFFEGLSFKLSEVQWKSLRTKTNYLMASLSDTLINSSPCFDCVSFNIVFNKSSRIARNGEERKIFREYDIFIRDSLLYTFYKKKESRIKAN